MNEEKLNLIINHAKRYGFIYKSSEIYNGIKGVYDYGPYGVEMKNNIKEYWWNYMVRYRENIVGIDTSILMNKKVWIASGHKKKFNEYFIKIKNKIYDIKKFIFLVFKHIDYKKKYRYIYNKILLLYKNKKFKLILKKLKLIIKYKKLLYLKNIKIKKINLMFNTKINSFYKDKYTYLRPETAQGIFINFKNIINSTKMKIPFGIAQIGKSFRNEIITKEFIFRTKEFEQMEMQFFIYPGEEKKWFKYWINSRLSWHYFFNLGSNNYKIKKHTNLSHYTTYATDIEFKFLNKYKELEGIHFRKNFDIKSHIKYSKKKIMIYNSKIKKKYIPYIIETSLGLDRVFYSLLCKSLINENNRIFLKLPYFISPIKVAILPLIKKDKKIIKISKYIYNNLKYKFNVIYDDKSSIGKRYHYQDSIGTPFCITIDKYSLINKTVTIRYRDNMKQIRYEIDLLYFFFKKEFDISYFFKREI
ncbi:MAG: glycine--tRNA ligase [Candidatus Shikimatogenerans bostrichidophilus]|nr:MAG: glycine--tRNA ligase [Candidatus Shikimatogenerans bostrichidophilus]